MYGFVCVWVHMCMYACRGHRTSSSVIFGNTVHPFETGSLVLKLPTLAKLAGSKHKGSACFCLLGVRLPSTWHQARHGTWILRLMLAKQALHGLSYPPSPQSCQTQQRSVCPGGPCSQMDGAARRTPRQLGFGQELASEHQECQANSHLNP